MKYGSITTGIIADGLIFNIDAANRASVVPSTSTNKAFNTMDTAIVGTFAADAQYDSSTISPSLAFDGTGDYIDYGNQFSSGLTQLTLSSWVYFKDADINEYDYFISKDGTTNRCFNLAKFRNGLWNTDGSISFWLSGNGSAMTFCGARTSDGFTPSNNTWYNVTGTYDGSNMKLYINNILYRTLSHTAGIHDSNNSLYMGYSQGAHASGMLNGNLGPTQIYNRALSANEVLHNYNALKGRFGL
jgi:hypothetical protein